MWSRVHVHQWHVLTRSVLQIIMTQKIGTFPTLCDAHVIIVGHLCVYLCVPWFTVPVLILLCIVMLFIVGIEYSVVFLICKFCAWNKIIHKNQIIYMVQTLFWLICQILTPWKFLHYGNYFVFISINACGYD